MTPKVTDVGYITSKHKEYSQIFNISGTIGMSVFFVLIPVAGCNRVAAIALLMTSTLLNALCMTGYQVNAQDLAPQYAGTVQPFSWKRLPFPIVIKELLHRRLTDWVKFYISISLSTWY